MTTQQTTSDWRNLIAACGAITVFGLAFGMTYPLLSLILEARDVSSDMIGMNSAMMPLGILLFSSVIPVAAKKFGARRIAIIAAIASAFIMILYKWFDTLSAWFLLRLIQGMTISTLFVLSESWIVKFAGDANRGKIVAIYASVLSLSFGAGPFIVSLMGIEGWAPFIIGMIVMSLGCIPLMFIQESADTQPEETVASGIFSFAPKAPMLMACVAAFSILDAATLALMPVYGIYNGLDVVTSANMLTALIVGNAVLQLPVGWLADKFEHRLVLAGCAFTTTVMLLILPFVIGSFWMWPVLVIAGTTGYGVYTVSLTSLGDRFTGTELVNGTSAFAVMWGVGALFGSVSAGGVMKLTGSHGLPVSLALVYLALMIGLIFRMRGHGK